MKKRPAAGAPGVVTGGRRGPAYFFLSSFWGLANVPGTVAGAAALASLSFFGLRTSLLLRICPLATPASSFSPAVRPDRPTRPPTRGTKDS